MARLTRDSPVISQNSYTTREIILGDETKEVDLTGKKLLIAVPSYDGTVPVEWLTNFTELVSIAYRNGVGVSIFARKNSSLIPKVRDEIIHTFLYMTDFNYLMCIDADIIWSPMDVVRLLARSDEFGVMFGAYPAKKDTAWFFPALQKVDGKPVTAGNLLKVKSAAAGFMMLNREILMDMYNKYPELHYQAAGDFVDKKHKVCAMFTPIIEDGHYRGEDVSFCRRLEKAGHGMWVDPDIELTHVGSKEYKYSYRDFVLSKFKEGLNK